MKNEIRHPDTSWDYYHNISERFNIPELANLYEEISFILYDKYFMRVEIDDLSNLVFHAQASIAKLWLEALKNYDIESSEVRSNFDKYYELCTHENYFDEMLSYVPNHKTLWYEPKDFVLPIEYLYFIALEHDLYHINHIIDKYKNPENQLLRHIIKLQSDYIIAYSYLIHSEKITDIKTIHQTATSRNARLAAISKHRKTNQKKDEVIHHFLQEQANSNISKNQFAKQYAKSYCQSEVTLRKWLKGDLSDTYEYPC